jgi:hypothetical protein
MYIEEKLRIALEQKIVGCSNPFDHQKLRDVRREFEEKTSKTCYEINRNFSEYVFNFSWFLILI